MSESVGIEASAPEPQGTGPGVASEQPPRGSLTEDQVNAPSWQTVGMLAAVCLTTLVCWGAGRAACNYHEIGDGLSPRAVSVEQRTRTPKDLAFELQQQREGANFGAALSLASGALSQTLQREQAKCGGAACDARRQRASELESVAELLAANPTAADVRVRTVGGSAPSERIYRVTRVGTAWKATEEFAANAARPPLPEPVPPALAPPPPSAAAPSAPGAPSASPPAKP